MQGGSPEEKRARHEEKPAADAPAPNPPADEEDEMLCRYCFEGTEEGELLSPCKCSGGQKWVHLSCLRRWQRMVLISQPTHPMFYTTDQRHYTCNVCASSFTCAPPTRQELMSSFTGPELGALMEEGCVIGAHDDFSRELATALEGMPEDLAEDSSYHHWAGGVYLITKVTPADAEVRVPVRSAVALSQICRQLSDDGRLTGTRNTVLQLLPVGPLAPAAALEEAPAAAGGAATPEAAGGGTEAPQGAAEGAMAVKGGESAGGGEAAGRMACRALRRIQEELRAGSAGGLLPLTLSFVKVPTPDCGEDHLAAVNLARPVAQPTPRMRRQVLAAVRSVKQANSDMDHTRIRLEHYWGGPCSPDSIACCVVTGGSSVGWTTAEAGLVPALSLAFGRASRCDEQGELVGGQAVRLVGLQSRPELNGAEGITLRFDPEAGRWLVRLADGDGKSLKPTNLEALWPRGPPLGQQDAAAAAEPEDAELVGPNAPPPGGPTVLVFWGDAQWSRVQLLGEIARGHWGLCRASVADLIAPPSRRRAGLDGRLVFAPQSEMTEQLGGGAGAQMDTMRQRLLRGREAPNQADPGPAAGTGAQVVNEPLPHTEASANERGASLAVALAEGSVRAALAATEAAAEAAAAGVEALVEGQADSEAEAEMSAEMEGEHREEGEGAGEEEAKQEMGDSAATEEEEEVEKEMEEEAGGYEDDTEGCEQEEEGGKAGGALAAVETGGYEEDVEDKADKGGE